MAARIGRGHRPFCSGGRCGRGPWALWLGVVHISAKVERQRGEHRVKRFGSLRVLRADSPVAVDSF